MKRTDVLLICIVTGIVLLVVVALVIALTRPEPSYQPEDTPEGVAHNYLLALQRGEYERAYSYLSATLPGYPASADQFTETVLDNRWEFRRDQDVSLEVEAGSVAGNLGTVTVRESRFYGGGLFESSEHTSRFELRLTRQDGEWKLTNGESYFAYCWRVEDGCKP